MKRKAIRRFLSAALCLSLGGCGYLFGDSGIFRDRSGDYRSAEAPPPIALPPGLESDSIAEIYTVPEVTAEPTLDSGKDVPRPDPLVSASADQLVRIQRLGDDSWVLVAIAPGQLWPQLRSFMSAANISIARMDARGGIIESTYLDLQGIERPARFRFRVERGVQRGNSELHVLQQYQSSDASWPEQSDDLELEGEMLRGIAQYIANSADTAPVSMMAEQSISAQARVVMREDAAGRPFIQLELPFDRAWASLARSLERSGFEITDRNRSAGNYYVTYVGEADEKKGGWFSWLGGGDDDHPAAGIPLRVSLEEQDPALMFIDLQVEQAAGVLDERDREALLVLIKGNID